MQTSTDVTRGGPAPGLSCRTATGAAMAAPLARATTYSWPYDYWHDRYQAYYARGLRAFVNRGGGKFRAVSMQRFPRTLRLLRRVGASHRIGSLFGRSAPKFQRGLDALAAAVGGPTSHHPGPFHPLVGRYLLERSDGAPRRVCVDAHDSGEVASPELLAWSDVYFKTNYWEGCPYPPKVVPLMNGNPLLLGRLGTLRRFRQRPSEYDLSFIVRVWGGADEREGVEHNLRLLEAAARVGCRKFLLAYLVAGDIGSCAARLERQGIPWTTRPLPLRELWEVSSRSRVNVIRLGMHGCVPWRMMDLLAMGACPVLDQPPFTRWPQPLREGEHFLSLGTATPPGRWLAERGQYDAVPARLEAILADDGAVQQVRANTAAYFDRFLTPENVGECIAGSVYCNALGR